MEVPDPRYVKTEDGAYIAYQVVGDGPVDFAWQFDFWETSTFSGKTRGIVTGSSRWLGWGD